jgi:hypothetical protein
MESPPTTPRGVDIIPTNIKISEIVWQEDPKELELEDINISIDISQKDRENAGERSSNEFTYEVGDNQFVLTIEDRNENNSIVEEPKLPKVPSYTEPKQEKALTCGTWCEEGESCAVCLCKFCCPCFWKLGQYCINQYEQLNCLKNMHIIRDTCNSIYFFFLYLLNGEKNKPAEEYIKKITGKKKDTITPYQIVETIIAICFELYKTIIGSFLTVFTAQKCGNQTCTIIENFIPKNDMELTALVFNFLMASTLITEYIFEIMREVYLMKYLKYDKKLGNNGNYIAELYEKSNKKIFKRLIPLYQIYIRFSYVVLLVYIANVIISGIVIRENYYDNTTLISFVTNALFIIYKIYTVVDITSYKGNYFYSAYKRTNIHYNKIRDKYLLTEVVHEPKFVRYISKLNDSFGILTESEEISSPADNFDDKDIENPDAINLSVEPKYKKIKNMDDIIDNLQPPPVKNTKEYKNYRKNRLWLRKNVDLFDYNGNGDILALVEETAKDFSNDNGIHELKKIEGLINV